jgi:hypothetical protein
VLTNEKELAVLCRALIAAARPANGTNRNLAVTPPEALEIVQSQIEGGADPLGEAFIHLRSPEQRRELGAVYTPERIVAAMVRWAAEHEAPTRIVDPGAGSGRFLLAAADAFPKAKLVGIERDPLAALTLKANLAVRGLSNRATVFVESYQKADLAPIRGRTLFIGNPPYVRHHQISSRDKEWFGKITHKLGVPGSKLAGLHIHFFVRTAQLARQGDFGTFITSSEWLDVNYGATLRALLSHDLGGESLHILDPNALPFQGAMTTGAITCFHVGNRPASFKVRSVETLDRLNGLSSGKEIPWSSVQGASRWSVLIKETPKPPPGYIELGELCRVHRGQVTGSNAVWIAGEHARGLPNSVLFPSVTKGRELLASGEALADAKALRRIIDLPHDLDSLSEEHRAAALRFLRFARASGAHKSYIAQHRKKWWSVGLKEPAPILVSYMARRPPSFIRNLCGARHINIAHGLYPRERLNMKTLDAMVLWLRNNVSVSSGRTYAGGLTKFEPREIERLVIPSLEMLA